jgi:hypothetical protein
VRGGGHAYFLYGVMSVTVFDSDGVGRGWEGDAGPGVASSGSSSLSPSSDAPISSSSGPRACAGRRDGRGRSVSSSNSSTTAVRRAMVVDGEAGCSHGVMRSASLWRVCTRSCPHVLTRCRLVLVQILVALAEPDTVCRPFGECEPCPPDAVSPTPRPSHTP